MEDMPARQGSDLVIVSKLIHAYCARAVVVSVCICIYIIRVFVSILTGVDVALVW